MALNEGRQTVWLFEVDGAAWLVDASHGESPAETAAWARSVMAELTVG